MSDYSDQCDSLQEDVHVGLEEIRRNTEEAEVALWDKLRTLSREGRLVYRGRPVTL